MFLGIMYLTVGEIVPYEISGVSCQNGGHFADDPKGISSAIGFCTK